MEKGYIENGFIVDVSNARKTSEIIYELSNILDLPDAQCKKVCLKLGSVDLTAAQLTSIKALVESMNSEIEFITTSSESTAEAAEELGINISELENVVPTPAFDDKKDEVNKELEKALDKIFGDEGTEIQTFATDKEIKKLKEDAASNESQISKEENIDSIETSTKNDITDKAIETIDNIKEIQDEIKPEPINFDDLNNFNSELENANSIDAEEVEYSTEEIKQHLKETEKLPTLYIQRTLRSGQSITSEGNITIIGDVNPGSEVIAKGDITVWGILGGIAHAGSDGNQYARIRALKMNAIQLRIADIFARRPDNINIPYIQKTDTFVPEEACVRKKQIYIHKMHDA